MKTLILVISIFFARSIFAQTDFKERSMADELKFQYENAKEPASVDDFEDLKNPGRTQSCVFWDSSQLIAIQIGSHTAKWFEGGNVQAGPLFPNREKTKKGLMIKSGDQKEWDKEIVAQTLKIDGVDLVWAFSSWNWNLRLRKDNNFIFFQLNNLSYGYCWIEKK